MIGYSDWRGVFYGFLLILPFLMVGFALFRVIWAIFWKKESENIRMEVLKKKKHEQSINMDLEKQAVQPNKKYLVIDRKNNFWI